MKVIRCPHCQSVCGIGTGYYHDAKLNICCKKCHKVIFATNEEDERELQKLFTRPVKEHHDSHHASNHHGSWNGGYPHSHGQHQHSPGRMCPMEERDDYD